MNIVKEGIVYNRRLIFKLFWKKLLLQLFENGTLHICKDSQILKEILLQDYMVESVKSTDTFSIKIQNERETFTFYVDTEVDLKLWIGAMNHCRQPIDLCNEAFELEMKDFTLIKYLNSGAFAEVCLCRLKTSEEPLSVKMIDRTSNHSQPNREASIMFSTQHAKYSFEEAKKCFIVMPFAVGGDLSNLVMNKECLTEEDAIFYGAEIISAIGHLHSMNIVHRDIKLENIMISRSGHILVTDFGISVENMPHGATITFVCGPALYRAPEMWKGIGYGRPVDWWATGLLLYKMVAGFMPFELKLMQVKQNDPNFTKDFKSLLDGLLDDNTDTRLGSGTTDAEEIKMHSIFIPIDWEKLVRQEIPPPFIPEISSTTDCRYFPRSRDIE